MGIFLSYYVVQPINILSIDLVIIWLAVPFTNIFVSVLSVSTVVGGCGWTIYDRGFRMDVFF